MTDLSATVMTRRTFITRRSTRSHFPRPRPHSAIGTWLGHPTKIPSTRCRLSRLTRISTITQSNHRCQSEARRILLLRGRIRCVDKFYPKIPHSHSTSFGHLVNTVPLFFSHSRNTFGYRLAHHHRIHRIRRACPMDWPRHSIISTHIWAHHRVDQLRTRRRVCSTCPVCQITSTRQ